MGVVTPTPTQPAIAQAVTDVPMDFASALRGNINARKNSLDAKVQLTQALLEALHGVFGFGALTGGTITVGTGLSVNIASLTAFVGAYVAYSGSQVVGGLEDNQLNYIFLRQDLSWTVPPGGSSTPPASTDGHGAALLWGTATTVSGGVTSVSNTRVAFADAVVATINALKVGNNLSDVASAATARTNLGAAASGANADITSLTALTTPLPMGGSGSPEGVVTATPGVIYTDETNGNIWSKSTGSGNTGWIMASDQLDNPVIVTAIAGAATGNGKRVIVTSESLTTAAGGDYVLTLTNSRITSSSLILPTIANGSNTTLGVTVLNVQAGSGTCTIRVRNLHPTDPLNGTIVIGALVS